MENTETKTKGKQGRRKSDTSARQIRLKKQEEMKAAGIVIKRGRPSKAKEPQTI